MSNIHLQQIQMQEPCSCCRYRPHHKAEFTRSPRQRNEEEARDFVRWTSADIASFCARSSAAVFIISASAAAAASGFKAAVCSLLLTPVLPPGAQTQARSFKWRLYTGTSARWPTLLILPVTVMDSFLLLVSLMVSLSSTGWAHCILSIYGLEP